MGQGDHPRVDGTGLGGEVVRLLVCAGVLDKPEEYERSDSRGIDNAVDICVSEAESGAERVGSVDSATRTPQGWRVSGELESGAAWSCAIDNDGRISDMNLGTYGYGTAPAERIEGGQWSDEAYRRARENQHALDGEVDADLGG